ncbi:hypothetical protein JXA32_02875 [Candidatus Sumerlaeota bacterium]|nr:hypothetical protein [Candidatus Sumerlaeota bacterium]
MKLKKKVQLACFIAIGGIFLYATQAMITSNAVSDSELDTIVAEATCGPTCVFKMNVCGHTIVGGSTEGASCSSQDDCLSGVWSITKCEKDFTAQKRCIGPNQSPDPNCEAITTIWCGKWYACQHADVDCENGKCAVTGFWGCIHIPYMDCENHLTC